MNVARHQVVQGVRVPTLLYGTAWKEEKTAPLTALALATGFRGIDTANQRRHYHEAGVGEAIQQALQSGLEREDLFVQTKFTHVQGQDHRLPYDPKAPPAQQVEQSLQSSLQHLGLQNLDCLVLHGPSHPWMLSEQDLATWRAMEAAKEGRLTRLIGVSNINIEQLRALVAGAKIPPAVVQNRCFTRPQADRQVRDLCQQHEILYQGFSLLTAIPAALTHPHVLRIAQELQRTPAQVILRYCLESNISVLTGTTSNTHMKDDLALYDFELAPNAREELTRLLG